MLQPISFFIGYRYSRSRSRSGFVSFITFFSIAGILLGVAALITVVSVMNGFEGELKKRILGLVPHVVVSQSPSVDSDNKRQGNFADWPSLAKQLSDYQGVANVSPMQSAEALIQSPSGLKGVLMQGVIPEYERDTIAAQNMVLGSFESLAHQPYFVVLGQALANNLKVSLGDQVRLVLPNKTVFTPMGRVPVQRNFVVGGIFNVGSQVDDRLIYVHANYGAKLLRRKNDGIDQLKITLDDAFAAEDFAQTLKAELPNATVTTWQTSQGALFSAVKMEKNMMWLMLSLIVAVAAFNIVSALVMVVIDKQGEIGILQTLGLSRTGVLKIFISQGMINGIWGTVLGTALGLILTLTLNDLLAVLGVNLLGNGYVSQALPIELVTQHVVVIVVGALAMSLLATLYPAYRAAQTQPAEVLRNE